MVGGGTSRKSTLDIYADRASSETYSRFSRAWDKRAWAEGANDLSKAELTHWLQGVDTNADGQLFSQWPHSTKRAGEARVWYAYPDQWPFTHKIGSWREPIRVGRVLDDGTSQITETSYDHRD